MKNGQARAQPACAGKRAVGREGGDRPLDILDQKPQPFRSGKVRPVGSVAVIRMA